MMATDVVERLPEELSLEILLHLSFKDRARSCLVNRAWNRLSRDQVLGPHLHLSPDLVGNRRFLQWACGRVGGVQELQVSWTGQKGVSKTDLFTGLSFLLSSMPNLQRLSVPHHFSLPPAILSRLPASLVDAHLCIAFNDSCLGDASNPDAPAYAFPEGMHHLKTLVMQISCVNVRSYGLVCPPANLPLGLESLTLTTRSWGRRVGPSLLLPPPRDLPNLQEVTLEATCFICQDGSTTVANFLGNCKQLHSFTLLSDRKAVDYQPLTDELSHLKKSTWVPL